jgi:hypothetical protein
LLGRPALSSRFQTDSEVGHGTIKIEQWKSDGIWRIEVYCGGPEARKINPAIIRIVDVDPKAKDPFSGRLLIDEMRELLKSQETFSAASTYSRRTRNCSAKGQVARIRSLAQNWIAQILIPR